ncbi:hypothetical protein [Corynebacterium sp. A21]|uniref:hypothetical protein n=1 Tax=Corynebacterium sp. A21 TaxID=3457318 RepID=UPI003FD0DD56
MENSAAQSPQPEPGSPHFGASLGFPAVTTVLANHDFHAYASAPTPALLLRGRSAGVATSPEELMESALHQPGDLPLRISSTKSEALKTGLGILTSFLLFLGGGMRLNSTGDDGDLLAAALICASIIAAALVIYFGVRTVLRLVKGPVLRLAASRKAVEKELGKPLDALPVYFVGERQLPPDERVLLQQMCGFYTMLQDHGYPMAVGQWRALTDAALNAVREYRVDGDLSLARKVGASIEEWAAASEQALHSRTEFTTRGMPPPPVI